MKLCISEKQREVYLLNISRSSKTDVCFWFIFNLGFGTGDFFGDWRFGMKGATL